MVDEAAIERQRAHLTGLLGFAQRRVDRAEARRQTADRELVDAKAQFDAATVELEAWNAAHPDPQMELI